MKKQSAEWYIAATHWLTATIASVVFGVVIGIILALISNNPVVLFVGFIIIYPLMMWFAVKYSARYLDKKYVIKNPNNIVILSTIYILLVGGGFRVYSFIANSVFTSDLIGFILAVIVFYIASKKYILKNTS